MPGVKEAELKARRRCSAAQLTSGLQSVSGTDRENSGVPNREPADEKDKGHVVMATKADDGCCARVARFCSDLMGREATVRFSWSGSVETTAQLK